jgi:UDP-N-acetylglucosamine--N-acetylmuramyl-(pentapeptide) pyrophosphoryl-undecaprenol N-acetylglucosamine transferase
MKVVIAGGGTAGHVNPALAIARSLGGEEIVFLGTSKGAEARLVPEHGYPLEEIEVRGFDRAKPLTIFKTGATAAKAFVSARKKLRRLDPDVVLGMGGYVSLPACIGARLLKVPIVLHEQNIVFGLANRVSKASAHTVCVSFEETLHDAGAHGLFTGNPVLPELVSIDRGEARTRGRATWDLDPERRTLLVFGGSQGARTVNEGAAGLADLWADRSDLQVLHITGRGSYETVKDAVGGPKGTLVYRVVDYVSAMGDAYSVADLALCRGGATTVAELGVVGVPAIVVPYPHHRDQQQAKHGRVLEAAGAGVVVPDDEATSKRIALEAETILSDAGRLAAMASAAEKLGRPDAAHRVADAVRGAVS